MSCRLLRCIPLAVSLALAAGCAVELPGPPPLRYAAVLGYGSVGPDAPPRGGFARCPYVRGTTIGFSAGVFADMAAVETVDPKTGARKTVCRTRQ